jgi:type II restriction enzyme
MSEELLSPEDLVREINGLSRQRNYAYLNAQTTSFIRLVAVKRPYGPIYYRRVNPKKGQSIVSKKVETISRGMLNRVAQAITSRSPISIDRILGASYNSRAVLEALLAYTPYFYYCYPGRLEEVSGKPIVKKGHKHLLYDPERPHQGGKVEKASIEFVVSEKVTVLETITLPAKALSASEEEQEELREHIRVQNNLRIIGWALGFRTYIAKDNQSVKIKDKPFRTLDGVVTDLGNHTIISSNHEACRAGRLLDCVWFENSKMMPAVFEVEDTTGVTSGLSRMMDFWEHAKAYKTRWVIVAPDHDRAKVMEEIMKPQFKALDARFLPYSNVQTLVALAQGGKLNGTNDQFLDGFMERPDGLLNISAN